MMLREHKYWIGIRIILLPILIFLFIDSFGQDNSNDKILRNEIGINLFTYLPSPEYKGFPYKKQFHFQSLMFVFIQFQILNRMNQNSI